ncbi:MAG: AmmeMemoRadiSam system radical SAM enzyme [Desulfobulbus sp.]|jgi:pyruvate formate lyase activating enzyme|uniref:AmmeMemoRadiSam system radical SAM enzyme n=1 Tax=Desulfobulbus sp. TaxID=895 RepID=UPI00283FCBB6|nr:AmmeMemoRadiSam system radical SAM enzyme [Desulfobulbus sp.]MDR2550378.1 AmmeMemoRadiSam system radical SAM enzyme [Desulfobulbus sp.]
MHEALFYQRLEGGQVACGLCARRCRIDVGRRGLCGVRENRDGRLVSLVYGKLVARNIDPIEKKPMFHFLPGSRSYSIATVGCNFRCRHCQNNRIAQYPQAHGGAIPGTATTPEEVVAEALRTGCASISYTYVEPTIFFEFACDCARLARERGIGNVFVSNGYMTTEAIRYLAPMLDGINIDLKAFTDEFYRTICRARLAPVLESIRLFHELGVLVEITTLIIPGLNDSEEELRTIACFLKSVSVDIPWHVTGFHPASFMLDRPPTPAATIDKAYAIGMEEGLRFVYSGNVAGAGGEDTYCPACGVTLIRRQGFKSQSVGLKGSRCSGCGIYFRSVGIREISDFGVT